jgi:BirA family transcriptional regulator, biotin operon repressor / biotin---[acetyl-CoA-carboxylase] ligase
MGTKDQVLALLKGGRGNWVSGESLSDRLSVSRSAVWKHVRKLKERGYHIQSSPKKGYLLQENSLRLLPDEIREGLKTTIFGRKEIFYAEEIGSTNNKAKELAAGGALEGTLVVSETQAEGRGRRGRSWFSPPQEGIYVSLVLRPKISPMGVSKITLMSAVALAETLSSLTRVPVRIKWPNDLLLGGKKVAGILTEISGDMDAVNYVVVGLGLNVNTAAFPEELRDKATSLRMETAQSFSRAEILKEYLGRWENGYKTLGGKGFIPLLRRWRELTDLVGRKVVVEGIDGCLGGTVEEIDDDGALILRGDDGRGYRIVSGDVRVH